MKRDDRSPHRRLARSMPSRTAWTDRVPGEQRGWKRRVAEHLRVDRRCRALVHPEPGEILQP